MKKFMIIIGLLLSFQMLQASDVRTVELKSGYNAVGFSATITLEELKNKIGVENLLNIQGAGQGSTYKKQYVDDGLDFLNSFTQTKFGEGYWIKVTNDVTFTYVADKYSGSKNIALGEGWSFITLPEPFTLEEIKEELGADNVLVIQGVGQGSTYKKEYVDNETPFLNSLELIEVGKGYWIKLVNVASLEFVFDLNIKAKDNANNDAEIVQTINDKTYRIRIYTDSTPTSETSQGSIAVYGNVNGETVVVSINDSYPTDAKFQVKIFDANGDLVTQSDIVDYNASAIEFSDVIIENVTKAEMTLTEAAISPSPLGTVENNGEGNITFIMGEKNNVNVSGDNRFKVTVTMSAIDLKNLNLSLVKIEDVNNNNEEVTDKFDLRYLADDTMVILQQKETALLPKGMRYKVTIPIAVTENTPESYPNNGFLLNMNSEGDAIADGDATAWTYTLVDVIKPVITLNGEHVVEVLQNGYYEDAGATAEDNVDGNITSRIIIDNPIVNENATQGSVLVNTSQPGTYIIKYNVTDRAGNIADEVTRTINVIAQEQSHNNFFFTDSSISPKPLLPVEEDGEGVISLTLKETSGIRTAGRDAWGDASIALNLELNYLELLNKDTSLLGGELMEYFSVSYTEDGTNPRLSFKSKKEIPAYKELNVTIPITVVTNSTEGQSNNAFLVNISPGEGYAYEDTYTLASNLRKPIISLLGNISEEIVKGSIYVDAGAAASDNLDGNLTSSIIVTSNVDTATVGSYTVKYNLQDSDGNRAEEVMRTVNVVAFADTTKPVITLIGDSTVQILKGTSYIDAGAMASDNKDGDIRDSIVTVNPLNTNLVGTYTITYNVKDAANNSAVEITRTVEVLEVPSDVKRPYFVLNNYHISPTPLAPVEENGEGEISFNLYYGDEETVPLDTQVQITVELSRLGLKNGDISMILGNILEYFTVTYSPFSQRIVFTQSKDIESEAFITANIPVSVTKNSPKDEGYHNGFEAHITALNLNAFINDSNEETYTYTQQSQ